ncbi:MAG: flagellar hook-associated protein FlgK [Zhongshania sp.]|uniref:flagellar hook-associated protein FlgK n=1 Tax=Zhongshania sp. TaxID=1971902 RepID=UPI002627EE93|nr:flagellar hook-associated protein FlgK [Zhongshania sp.]MDF1690897.1 flagellar hook-associated protein FlgK [Zhongshania sp.]
MGDMLGNALSALVSYQRALATTSHNIANADTEGYSRQRVDFATRTPQQLGSTTIGSGVKVSSVSRVYDNFTAGQLRSAQAAFSAVDNSYQLASQLDNALADPNLGLGAALSRYYNSIQGVADDPSSISSRQLMLAEAQGLGDRFADLSAQLDGLSREVNVRISTSVSDINDLATQIADINLLISESEGKFGTTPNDLLDQRDQALLSLNELIGVKSVEQDDGTVSVFVGNGEALVLGDRTIKMNAVSNVFEPGRIEIAMDLGGGQAVISGSLSGGSLGGSLNFRDGLLNETRNELGRITLAVASSMNEQNRAGIDLRGNQGADIFSVPEPVVHRSINNTSAAQMTAEITDLSQVTGNNVLMRFNGSSWSFFDEANGAPVTGVTGSGSVADPFQLSGVQFSLNGAAAAGDQFVLRPTEGATAGLNIVLTDPAGIAAAAATRSSAAGSNIGSGSISQTEVVNSSDPNLLSNVDIEFLTATTYQINGSGNFTYTPGAELNINGNKVVINGSPIVGDQFSIGANTNAVGDNRNILKLAGAENLKMLNGGTVSVQDAVNGLVGDIAVATRSAQINKQSQENLLTQTRARYESVSGVNLDEEAANLLKFQQAYQAAAQATSIANDLFQTLMGAFR